MPKLGLWPAVNHSWINSRCSVGAFQPRPLLHWTLRKPQMPPLLFMPIFIFLKKAFTIQFRKREKTNVREGTLPPVCFLQACKFPIPGLTLRQRLQNFISKQRRLSFWLFVNSSHTSCKRIDHAYQFFLVSSSHVEEMIFNMPCIYLYNISPLGKLPGVPPHLDFLCNLATPFP